MRKKMEWFHGRKYHFEGKKKRYQKRNKREKERYCYKEMREGKESLGERVGNVHRTGWTWRILEPKFVTRSVLFLPQFFFLFLRKGERKNVTIHVSAILFPSWRSQEWLPFEGDWVSGERKGESVYKVSKVSRTKYQKSAWEQTGRRNWKNSEKLFYSGRKRKRKKG